MVMWSSYSSEWNLIPNITVDCVFKSNFYPTSSFIWHWGSPHREAHPTPRWSLWVHHLQGQWHQRPYGVWAPQTTRVTASGSCHCSGKDCMLGLLGQKYPNKAPLQSFCNIKTLQNVNASSCNANHCLVDCQEINFSLCFSVCLSLCVCVHSPLWELPLLRHHHSSPMPPSAGPRCPPTASLAPALWLPSLLETSLQVGAHCKISDYWTSELRFI